MNLRNIIAIILTVAAIIPTDAKKWTIEADDLHVSDLKLSVDEHARKVDLTLALNLRDFHPGTQREWLLTPVLVADDRSDSIAFPTLTVAGRSRWFLYERDGETVAENLIYRAGAKQQAVVTQEVSLLPWMSHSTLEMRVKSANCCDEPQQLWAATPSGNIPMAEVDFDRTIPDLPLINLPAADAGPVSRSITGTAFITFPVNRTNLLPDYMLNRKELQKITRTIDQVKADPEVAISSVHIKGYASPEGSYENNVRLAAGRTETLRRHVRDLYRFNDSLITSSFEAEDWQGLRSYVKDSMQYALSDRAALLKLIDSDLEPDAKDAALKRDFPADYALMLKDIYPWLRRSDYAVNYTIKEYTTLADICRVYATDPSRLRNVDFFTLADSFPEGSEERLQVMLKAAEVYPADPTICIDAANLAMEHGRLDTAQTLLDNAGYSAGADYARGVLAARRGNLEKAAALFKAAANEGFSGAAEARAAVDDALAKNPVTYLITPETGTEKK